MEEKTGGKKEKTDENSGHYVIARSRPPERRELKRRRLLPIKIVSGMECKGRSWLDELTWYW